jgi:hypothetical protein
MIGISQPRDDVAHRRLAAMQLLGRLRKAALVYHGRQNGPLLDRCPRQPHYSPDFLIDLGDILRFLI